MTYLRFDYKSDRIERRANDKWAPIRDIFETINASWSRYHTPRSFLTVYEHLVGFRGIQNMCLWSLTSIFVLTITHSTPWQPSQVLEKKIYAPRPGNIGLGSQIVIDLTRKYFGSGHNITKDSHFTSYDLDQMLLAKKMTFVRPAQPNKRFIPKKFRTKLKIKAHPIFGFHSWDCQKESCPVINSTLHQWCCCRTKQQTRNSFKLQWNWRWCRHPLLYVSSLHVQAKEQTVAYCVFHDSCGC